MLCTLDLYRSAKLLVDQHGEDAPIFAAMQADKCLEAGDLDGKAVPTFRRETLEIAWFKRNLLNDT